jgi:Fe-S-cluster containining protein
VKEIIFYCTKCGICCNSLLENIDGIVNGLHLTEKETRLFQPELVSPQTAIGFGKPEKIISYQLNVAVCPHLGQKNECRIYEKRPLACQSYPIHVNGLDVKCPQIGSVIKEGEFCECEFSEIEKKAVEKINRYYLNRTKEYFEKGAKLWRFDLSTRKWVISRERTR